MPKSPLSSNENRDFFDTLENAVESDLNGVLVRVGRLELPASTSQMWRPTNWATPGNCLVFAAILWGDFRLPFRLWSGMWSSVGSEKM